MKRKKKSVKILLRVLNGIAMAIVGIVFCLPFVWMILTAFKSLGDTILIPPKWFLDELHWENFAAAWQSGPFLHYIWNSIVSTVGILALQFLVAVPAMDEPNLPRMLSSLDDQTCLPEAVFPTPQDKIVTNKKPYIST